MFRRLPLRSIVKIVLMTISVISLSAVTFAAPAPTVVSQNPVVGGIRTPLRICIGSAGTFYVSDALAGGILCYNQYGVLVNVIKTAKQPQGIAVAADGTLIVGQGDAAVFINSTTGAVTGSLGAGSGQFKMVNGIAVDAAGFIYVVDSLANCVQVFTSGGVYSRRFGSFGTAAGQFSTPSGIAYEKVSNQIAVVDTRNGRVQFFDTNGVHKRTVGVFGSGSLKFTAPQGVAFEYAGGNVPVLSRMYVVDTFQSTLQAIDMSAAPAFLSYIGGYGNTNGKLMVPSDVVFDPANRRLLVVNGFGNLTVYGIDGGTSPILTDSTPPAVAIDPVSSPFTASLLEMTGTREDAAVVSVAAPAGMSVGQVAYPSATTWKVQISGFTPGDTVIAVTARDAANNAATVTATVSYLLPAPALAVAPLPVLTNAFNQTMTGTVDAGATVTVTNAATGVAVNAVVSGFTWTAAVGLIPGTNSLTVAAVKPQSATATAGVSTILDAVPPVLAVSALPDKSHTSAQVQNVTLKVTEEYLDRVSVNGQPVAVANGECSTAVTLNQGANTITVAAADLAGNVSVDSRTIHFDDTLPEIVFTAPADGVSVATDHVTVSGTVDDSASVTVAGIPADTQGTSWSATVSLAKGLNTLTVAATDLAGNQATAKRSVFFDSEAPSLSISSPSQDVVTNRSTVTMAGSFSDNEQAQTTVSATVNGTPVAVSATGGAWTLSTVLPAEGAYAVAVTATDAAGNVSIATRTIIYDATPPVLTMNPVNTAYPSTLSGAVEQAATVAVEDKNGSAGTVAMNGTSWTATLTLGAYDQPTLAVRATDAAGNSTIRSLVVKEPDGDLDGDGKVTTQDAVIALRINAGKIKPTAAHLAHGDIGPLYLGKPQPNGVIDLVDALLILRKARGMQSW